MQNVDGGDTSLVASTTNGDYSVQSNGGGSGLSAPAPGSTTTSVCVVCCSTASLPYASVHRLIKAFTPVAAVRGLVLSEGGFEVAPGVESIQVPSGTKLSKIRRLADLITADLVCICDPDLTVIEEPCRLIFERAAQEVRAGKEVAAFGIVESQNNGSLVSRAVAVDKWLSHRVLRRCLWALGIGITIPGQFLIVSPGLLRGLDPRVDSYLDDLYLGWVARRKRARIHRVPVVVGHEDSRTNWVSLLTQRLRWMRGFFFLIGHLRSNPSAVGLLLVHYFAYHGLAVLGMFCFMLVCGMSPVAGLFAFLGVASLLSVLSRQPLLSVVVYLAAFPVMHLLATLLWWVPVSRLFLTRR